MNDPERLAYHCPRCKTPVNGPTCKQCGLNVEKATRRQCCVCGNTTPEKDAETYRTQVGVGCRVVTKYVCPNCQGTERDPNETDRLAYLR